MDDGQVIPGLNEDYTFGGAKVMEWIAGITTGLLCHEAVLNGDGKSMPIVMVIVIGATFGLAGLRRRFPDEERGVRNFFMVGMGLPPPGIPTPAALQSYWSGAPMRREAMPESVLKREYVQLGIAAALAYKEVDPRAARVAPPRAPEKIEPVTEAD